MDIIVYYSIIDKPLHQKGVEWHGMAWHDIAWISMGNEISKVGKAHQLMYFILANIYIKFNKAQNNMQFNK